MSTDNFTLAGYRELIEAILGRGYSLRSFHDVEPGASHLVLRHDVDQSIAIARELADLEIANGWRSTWFILVRTEMYNAFSRAAVADMRALLAAGHEIGLHLDATHYDGEDALDRGCALECDMLEQVIAVPVRLVSFHRPPRERLGGIRPIGGRQHTYMDRFFREMGYCSDSRGEWRHGHPLAHPALCRSQALQLLVHAVWWVGAEPATPRERLRRVLDERAATLEAELAANNDVWRTAGMQDREKT